MSEEIRNEDVIETEAIDTSTESTEEAPATVSFVTIANGKTKEYQLVIENLNPKNLYENIEQLQDNERQIISMFSKLTNVAEPATEEEISGMINSTFGFLSNMGLPVMDFMHFGESDNWTIANTLLFNALQLIKTLQNVAEKYGK